MVDAGGTERHRCPIRAIAAIMARRERMGGQVVTVNRFALRKTGPLSQYSRLPEESHSNPRLGVTGLWRTSSLSRLLQRQQLLQADAVRNVRSHRTCVPQPLHLTFSCGSRGCNELAGRRQIGTLGATSSESRTTTDRRRKMDT